MSLSTTTASAAILPKAEWNNTVFFSENFSFSVATHAPITHIGQLKSSGERYDDSLDPVPTAETYLSFTSKVIFARSPRIHYSHSASIEPTAEADAGEKEDTIEDGNLERTDYFSDSLWPVYSLLFHSVNPEPQ